MEQPDVQKKAAKIAIVTGGNRGIGRNTIRHLARRNVTSIFTYNSHRDEADEVVAEVAEIGAKAIALPLNVNDVTSFTDFAGEVKKKLKELGTEKFHFLVNNAGIGLHKAYESVTEDDLDKLIAVHMKGPFFLTQKLIPMMADGGRIVNISSGLTRFCFPGAGSYALVKGAVEVFTRYLAKEYGARGIAANTVAPGAIATEFNGARTRDDPKVNKAVADNTALGRAGEADDVGPVIASLLDEENRWINAQRIEVSGGMML